MKRLSTIVMVWALAAGLAEAQTLTGNMIGTVKDESGAVLPGVTVTITSPGALPGGPVTVVTNEKGEYRFSLLQPGVYGLTITLVSFSTYQEDGLRIDVSGTIERNVTLKLASVAETITVSNESPMVDPRKVGVTANLKQEVLESLPSMRDRILELGKWTAGVAVSDPSSNSVTFSVLGSGEGENLVLYEGAVNNNPSDGSISKSGDTDTVAEIQFFTLGASAEYQVAQGAVFNVVFKSGTNTFKTDVNAFWRPSSLLSQPIKLPCGCDLGQTGYSQTLFQDASIHVGGPILKDRLWFYSGFAHYASILSNPGIDPRLVVKRSGDKVSNKVTWQVNERLRVKGYALNGDWFKTPGLPSLSRPYETTTLTHQTDHFPLYSFETNYTISNKTLLTFRWAGFGGPRHFVDPLTGDKVTPYRVDSLTGIACCGVPSFEKNDKATHAQMLKLDRYVQSAHADHDLRFGIQLGEAHDKTWDAYPSGVQYSDLAGRPDQATFRDPYVQAASYNSLGLFGEDQFTIAGRLTLSVGVRFDRMHGASPDMPAVDNLLQPTGATIKGLGDLFTWNVVSPRLGFNLKVTADGKTVMRGTAGRAYRSIFLGDFENIHPGQSPITLTRFNPATGGYTTVISVTDPLANIAFDDNVKAPFTDQYSIGLDRELMRSLGVNITYVHKRGGNLIGWSDIGGVYSTQTVALANGQSVTVDPLVNSANARKFLRTNGPGFFTNYNGLLVTIDKRMSRRWAANVSYTYSKSEGLALTGTAGQDPNDLVNAAGLRPLDRPQMLTATGTYEVPRIGVTISPNFMALTGTPFAPQAQISLPQGRRSVNIAPVDGSYRLASQELLGLRVGKVVFRHANREIDVFAMITNALQSEAPTALVTQNLFSTTFATASAWVTPRREFFQVKAAF